MKIETIPEQNRNDHKAYSAEISSLTGACPSISFLFPSFVILVTRERRAGKWDLRRVTVHQIVLAVREAGGVRIWQC